MTEPLFTPDTLREQVIRPALQALEPFIAASAAAEDILLGIAVQESGLRFTRQENGGPALGLWQMEPASHDDCWENFLHYRRDIARKVGALSVPAWQPMSWPSWPHAGQLETNHKYACAMARVKLFRSPLPLPAQGDIASYAHLWKVAWNTADGAGTEQEFIDNWNATVGDQA